MRFFLSIKEKKLVHSRKIDSFYGKEPVSRTFDFHVAFLGEELEILSGTKQLNNKEDETL